jgi:hypothetical protein
MNRLFFLACLLLTSACSDAQQTMDTIPHFPGGDSAWKAYCQSTLITNLETIKRYHLSCDADIYFMVDKDGAVTAAHTATSTENALEKIIVSMILASPKWSPAYKRGKPVGSLRRQHFTIDPEALPELNLDSLDLVRTGDTVPSGPKIIYRPDNHELAGHLVNWKRQGWWTYYMDDTVKATQVEYEDGIASETRIYDERGNVVADFLTPDQEASFPGGDRGWSEYVRKALMEHIDKLVNSKANGTVEVGFWVDSSGSISQVTALWPTGTALDKIAVNIIQNGPAWQPATTGGVPVRDYRKQRITFMQPSQ